MLKIVLADDEKIVREGLLELIDWKAEGFEVVGTAVDGMDALNQVKEKQPELIITDIRMPFLSGLKFIKQVKAEYTPLQFIIISGHDEFEYAQEALKLGVADFLVKPVEPEELIASLNKVKERITERLAQMKKVEQLEQKISFQETLIHEKQLYDLIFKKKDLPTYSSELTGMFLAGCYQVMIIQLDDYLKSENEPENDAENYTVHDFYSLAESISVNRSNIFFIHSRSNEVIFLVHEKSEGNLKSLRRTVIDESGSLPPGRTRTVGFSSVFSGIGDISKAYGEAVEAISEKFIAGSSGIYNFSGRNRMAVPKKELSQLDTKPLLESIKRGDSEELSALIKSVRSIIEQRGASVNEFAVLAAGIVFHDLIMVIRESGGNPEEIFEKPIEEYKAVAGSGTIEKMMHRLERLCISVQKYLILKSSGDIELLMKKVADHLDRKYSEYELNLASVAEHFYISPGYLCALFKPHLGVTFKEYLTRTRIEKAKDLILTTSMKSYEVGLAVGYDNPTYFSTVFKRQTGHSPGDFKKQFRS